MLIQSQAREKEEEEELSFFLTVKYRSLPSPAPHLNMVLIILTSGMIAEAITNSYNRSSFFLSFSVFFCFAYSRQHILTGCAPWNYAKMPASRARLPINGNRDPIDH